MRVGAALDAFCNMLILKDIFYSAQAALSAAILACAALGAAAVPAHAEPPPVVNDLAATLKLAREQRVPVFVAFTLRRCPYCNSARRDYWQPMYESAQWRSRVLMVEVMLDGAPELRDFDGSATTTRAFGKRLGIRSVPTVIVFDTSGAPAAEPVVGLASADFYGAYLDNAITLGQQKVRESK